MSDIRIFTTPLTNPCFNLAAEEWLFNELPSDTFALFLWRNSDSIILGHHQDAQAECKVEKIQRDQVMLARRYTGGGAVFHDLGNTNFSLLCPRAAFGKNKDIQVIIDALAILGVNAKKSGRNDLVVDDKKVSGTAIRYNKDRVLLHGTLLIDVDMSKLSFYLTPNPLKLKDKQITSVRARVANLKEFLPDVTHHVVNKSIIRAFCTCHGQNVSPEVLDENVLSENSLFRNEYSKLTDKDWIINTSVPMTYNWTKKFPWGLINVNLNEDKEGMITDVAVYSDCLDVNFISEVKKALRSQAFNPYGFTTALEPLTSRSESWSNQANDVIDWLSEEFSNAI